MKMKKLNVIDVIILAVVIAAIAGVALLKTHSGKSEQTTKTVVLELMEKHEGFSENVVVGDKVIEKVKKTQIGEVTGVEVLPSEKNSYDRRTGEPMVINIPEREDVYVTMEISGDAEVYVGKTLSVVTKHFSGSGYVMAVSEKH